MDKPAPENFPIIRYWMIMVILIILWVASDTFFKNHVKFDEKPQALTPLDNVEYPILEDATGSRAAGMVTIPAHLRTNAPQSDLKFTIGSKFSADDIEIARRAVKLCGSLTSEEYPVYFANMYWGKDMLKDNYLGMTFYHHKRAPWYSYMVIAEELKPDDPGDLNQLRDFGNTIIHECDHSRNLASESLVNFKIDGAIEFAFHEAMNMAATNFYQYRAEEIATKPYSNMLEKHAYEVGIPKPWTYVDDYKEFVRKVYVPVTYRQQ